METIELRSSPKLNLSWNQRGFQVFDSADPNNNGDYPFLNLKEVKFHQAQINWFVSGLSFIVDIFTGTAMGGRFKNKPTLRFNLDSQTLKILLIDADLKKAEAVAVLLNSKRTMHNT